MQMLSLRSRSLPTLAGVLWIRQEYDTCGVLMQRSTESVALCRHALGDFLTTTVSLLCAFERWNRHREPIQCSTVILQ